MEEKEEKYTYKIRQKRLSRATYSVFDVFVNNMHFIVTLGMLSVVAFFITGYPLLARGFGFFVASYGLVANDSIQTLGVFITANAHRNRWWVMWGFISFVFFLTVSISWLLYEGDVSYQRLKTEGLSAEISHLTFAQLLAPIVLLLLTRLGIPVSTTFLLLNIFVTEWDVVQKMIYKSISGYVVAFIAAFIVWGVILNRKKEKSKTQKSDSPAKIWFVWQWLSSGLLWAGWLMQDGANMAIFLPRALNGKVFCGFVACVVCLLGFLFYSHGGEMQRIVDSKAGITDVRAAVSVNVFYMLLLFFFMISSTVPMSTTWMFIGLLGGREVARGIWLKSQYKNRQEKIVKSFRLIGRDLLYALSGLIVSIFLSIIVNPVVREVVFPG